jgi:hypothetical protein
MLADIFLCHSFKASVPHDLVRVKQNKIRKAVLQCTIQQPKNKQQLTLNQSATYIFYKKVISDFASVICLHVHLFQIMYRYNDEKVDSCTEAEITFTFISYTIHHIKNV